MFIDQVRTLDGYILKLSVVDNETSEQMDFDLRICTDNTRISAIARNLGTESAKHYLVVENVVFADKTVNFQSDKIASTIYLILSNGKVYRWTPVAVTPIRVNDKPYAMVVASATDATVFNRRNSFRVSVDTNGKLDWRGYEDEIPCFVLNVCHDGIAVSISGVKALPGVGEHCKITWNDGTSYEVEGIVRRSQHRLGEQYILGMALAKEPDEIRSMIQRIQTSRAIASDLIEEKKDVGVRRLENWELEKDLENNGFLPGE